MPNITDVLNEYNSEHGALRGSSVATALKETLSTINQTVIEAGEELPEVATIDAGKVLKVNAAGHWVVDTDDDNELPTVTVSDAGKVLKVDAEGHWTADADCDNELPTVTSADAGKALVVNDQGEWEAGNVSTPEPKVFNGYVTTAASTAAKVVTFTDPAPSLEDLNNGALIRIYLTKDNTATSVPTFTVTTSDSQTLTYNMWDPVGRALSVFVSKIVNPDNNSYYQQVYYTFKLGNTHPGQYYSRYGWIAVKTEPEDMVIVTGAGTSSVSLTYLYKGFYPLNLKAAFPGFSSSYSGRVLSVNSSGNLTWMAHEALPTHNSLDQNKVLTITANNNIGWQAIPQEVPSVSYLDEGKVLTVEKYIDSGGYHAGRWIAAPRSQDPDTTNVYEARVTDGGYGPPEDQLVTSNTNKYIAPRVLWAYDPDPSSGGHECRWRSLNYFNVGNGLPLNLGTGSSATIPISVWEDAPLPEYLTGYMDSFTASGRGFHVVIGDKNSPYAREHSDSESSMKYNSEYLYEKHVEVTSWYPGLYDELYDTYSTHFDVDIPIRGYAYPGISDWYKYAKSSITLYEYDVDEVTATPCTVEYIPKKVHMTMTCTPSGNVLKFALTVDAYDCEILSIKRNGTTSIQNATLWPTETPWEEDSPLRVDVGATRAFYDYVFLEQMIDVYLGFTFALSDPLQAIMVTDSSKVDWVFENY